MWQQELWNKDWFLEEQQRPGGLHRCFVWRRGCAWLCGSAMGGGSTGLEELYRQGMLTTSTAEAELVEVMEGGVTTGTSGDGGGTG